MGGSQAGSYGRHALFRVKVVGLIGWRRAAEYALFFKPCSREFPDRARALVSRGRVDGRTCARSIPTGNGQLKPSRPRLVPARPKVVPGTTANRCVVPKTNPDGNRTGVRARASRGRGGLRQEANDGS